MQKYVRRINVNLVDLVKSFQTNIFLQNLASIQRRTSPIKFDHLAEKSEKGSISNLSTKLQAAEAPVLVAVQREQPRLRLLRDVKISLGNLGVDDPDRFEPEASSSLEIVGYVRLPCFCPLRGIVALLVNAHDDTGNDDAELRLGVRTAHDLGDL